MHSPVGRDTVQTVSRRLLSVGATARFQANPCGLYRGKRDSNIGSYTNIWRFPLSLSFRKRPINTEFITIDIMSRQQMTASLNKMLFNYSDTNSRHVRGTKADKHKNGRYRSGSTNLCKDTQCTASRMSFLTFCCEVTRNKTYSDRPICKTVRNANRCT